MTKEIKKFVEGFTNPMKKKGKSFTKEIMENVPVKKPKQSVTKDLLGMK